MIEEVISYKTEDGRTFTDKKLAIKHITNLESKRKLTEIVKKVKQLFKKGLTMYANGTKEYSGISLNNTDLECDFWDEESRALSDNANMDITIEDFDNYVSLVKTLLEDFHLERVIKIIKKTAFNNSKETA